MDLNLSTELEGARSKIALDVDQVEIIASSECREECKNRSLIRRDNIVELHWKKMIYMS